MTTLDHITRIIAAKKGKVFPEHCQLIELINATGRPLSELRPELLRLVKSGDIIIGQTINSHYIKINGRMD